MEATISQAGEKRITVKGQYDYLHGCHFEPSQIKLHHTTKEHAIQWYIALQAEAIKSVESKLESMKANLSKMEKELESV